METKVVVIPRLPQEIIDEIFDHLSTDSESLQSCALVSRSCAASSRRHLFYTILFTPRDMVRWLETFPAPEESPAHHVRDLRFSVGRDDNVPERFFEYTPWFTNVERTTLSAHEGIQPLRVPPFLRLPESVTSLTINADTLFLEQIRVIMTQLPNLDNLSLSGHILVADEGPSLGTGEVLRGRFGGQLRLLRGYATDEAMNMLLEIPTGLHFTEMEIHGIHDYLPLTVRLAEACAKTLVKLSYTIPFHNGCETFGRPFDLSKFPNLQEVSFGIGWFGGGIPWIPPALSSIRPTTSPHLSAIQLSFDHPLPANRYIDAAMIKVMDSDLRWVADEVARIEREFEGAVNLVVLRDAGFKVVLDKLNILQLQR